MMSKNKHKYKPSSFVLVSSDAHSIRTTTWDIKYLRKLIMKRQKKEESKQPVEVTENKNIQVDMDSAYTHASAHTHLYNTSAIQI
jgi:hypothetical protein